MNLKKAKKLRKALGYHPSEAREYEPGLPRVNKGGRRIYRMAKRSAKRARAA